MTAGPTVEDIDPVRFIGNRSSGKMGFAIAERAAARGGGLHIDGGRIVRTHCQAHQVRPQGEVRDFALGSASAHAAKRIAACAALFARVGLQAVPIEAPLDH